MAVRDIANMTSFGLNTGIGDAYDIGWKLSSVLSGFAGPQLLDSYDLERRPVSVRNTAHTSTTFKVHMTMWKWIEENPSLMTAQTVEGRALRKRVDDHLQQYDQENQDFGVESDYRYNGSPIILADNEVTEPPTDRGHCIPSTWPGARAPAVILEDGKTNVHDLFGRGLEYTLINFSTDTGRTTAFEKAARDQHVPLKVIHLPKERHVRTLYERDVVLIRPDGHVGWRCRVKGDDLEAHHVISTATGKMPETSALVVEAAEKFQGSVSSASVACMK